MSRDGTSDAGQLECDVKLPTQYPSHTAHLNQQPAVFMQGGLWWGVYLWGNMGLSAASETVLH